MKIHTQGHCKIGAIILFSLLSLNSAIASSQDSQKSSKNTTQLADSKLIDPQFTHDQLTRNKLKPLAAIPKTVEREQRDTREKREQLEQQQVRQAKAELAALPIMPALATTKVMPTIKVMATVATSSDHNNQL